MTAWQDPIRPACAPLERDGFKATHCDDCGQTLLWCTCGTTQKETTMAGPNTPAGGRPSDSRARLIAYLREHPSASGVDAELVAEVAVPGLTRRGAKSLLQRMVADNTLRRVSQGRYALAEQDATSESEGSAPTEAGTSANTGSADASEGKPATDGGADGPALDDVQERLRSAGFDVPVSRLLRARDAEMRATLEWLERAQSDMDDPGPTPAWLEPYCVDDYNDHIGPPAEAEASAAIDAEGPAVTSVAPPVPTVKHPLPDDLRQVTPREQRAKCRHTGKLPEECPWRDISTAPCEHEPTLESVTKQCEQCGELSYSTRERRVRLPDEVLATDIQFPDFSKYLRDPTQAERAIVTRTMAELAAKHTAPPTPDEARALLVRLRHFVDAAEAVQARPKAVGVRDLDAKRAMVESVASFLADRHAHLLRNLLSDAERLQALAEAGP